MTFDVEWDPAAEAELTRIWIAADALLRGTITKSTRALDRLLEKDPVNQGESRPNDRRIMFDLPLGIVYEVIPANKLVRVLFVWQVRRR